MKHGLLENMAPLLKYLAWSWFLAAGPLFAQTQLPPAADVAQAMTRANDYFIAHNRVGAVNWQRGVYFTGNQRAFRVLGNRDYYRWALAWGQTNAWKPTGNIFHADQQCCGQTFIDLYRLDREPSYLTSIKAAIDAVVATNKVDYWSWIDAFYMAGPVFARLGNLTGDTNYYLKHWLMFNQMKSRYYDPSESLWYRDQGQKFPSRTNACGGKVFWARGNGWVFAGLARSLEQMPVTAPHYQDYVAIFQTMAAKLKSNQGVDGLWRASLLCPEQFPNAETSGTALFTYGLAWGIRNKLLSAAEYSPLVLRAWHGLATISLQTNGLVGYVQPPDWQPGPSRASQTSDYGVGAFLLAGSEVYLLAPDAPSLRPWAGAKEKLVDRGGNGKAPVSLDASETEIYKGRAVDYSWWEGTNKVANGIQAQVALDAGAHQLTLRVLGGDGVSYTDSRTVEVVSAPK
jgi:unsaturated rhamnogalacturonyl hydrolase